MPTPMVDPTKPITNSIDGIIRPSSNANKIIDIVMYLKRCSGM